MNDAIGKAAVLLVEDDALIREALGEALAERGFGVVAVDDADAAMRTLTKDNKIGAVISDVKMPGSLDGVGLAGWMKEHAPGVPVVLISGFPFMTDLAAINPAI